MGYSTALPVRYRHEHCQTSYSMHRLYLRFDLASLTRC